MFAKETRILVVDDMLTMRKLMSKALKELGFSDLTEAVDGQKGWEALQSATPAIGLVVSDCGMPNCSGLDLLKRVRGDGRFKNLPFILLTMGSEGVQAAEAAKAGVDANIIKPFTPDVIKAKIEETFKKATSR